MDWTFFQKVSLLEDKLGNTFKSQTLISNILPILEKSSTLPLKEDIDDMPTKSTCGKTAKKSSRKTRQGIQSGKRGELFTQESAENLNYQNLPIKSNFFETDIQIMNLSKILDQDSITTVKAFVPFWTQQSQETSKKLWLPTPTDLYDSVSPCFNTCSEDSPRMLKSSYPVKKIEKFQPKKNFVRTSCPLLHVMPQRYTVAEAIVPEKPKDLYKTKCVRLFPEKVSKNPKSLLSENTQIQIDFGIFRWFCNYTRDVLSISYQVYLHYKQELETKLLDEWLFTRGQKTLTEVIKKFKEVEKNLHEDQLESFRKKHKVEVKALRSNLVDIRKTKEYKSELKELQSNDLFCDFTKGRRGNELMNTRVRDLMKCIRINEDKVLTYDPVLKEGYQKPSWLTTEVHNRIIRGAIKLTVANFQSSITNYKEGNISSFEFKRYLSKKTFNLLHFEDEGLPSYIKKIKRNGGKGSQNIDWSKGCTIKYDPRKKSYTLYYPVKIEVKSSTKKPFNEVDLEKDIVTSIDEGITNTHVMYTHNGPKNKDVVEIHSYMKSDKVKRLLERSDSLRSRLDNFKNEKREKRKIEGIRRHMLLVNKKLSNIVLDCNKKLASRLAENNDHILLPKFSVSEIAKRTNLQSSHKRLLYLGQFYKFKEFLSYKCNVTGTNLYEVTEDYTSKTCGNCGSIDCYPHTSSRVHICKSCNFKCDRDVNGSRNIMIKNLVPLFLKNIL